MTNSTKAIIDNFNFNKTLWFIVAVSLAVLGILTIVFPYDNEVETAIFYSATLIGMMISLVISHMYTIAAMNLQAAQEEK